MDNRINFHDSALCEAASVTAPRLLNLTNNLDQISDDIKRLEAWLSEHGLCIEIEHSLEEKPWVRISDGEQIATERIKLKWEKHESKWRLVYESRYIHENDYERNRYLVKPLIEMPAQVRIDVRQHLPEFVRAIGDALPEANSEPLNLENWGDSETEIPF
ncbi:MAG: hypothetical protein EKK48_24130 [Candidatus Melainabacteria bacterium]|jgi:hypothetical protein|nr:MAG: hypothetical protein EKK48_24130 [Candidatus Melainabacteria bacterium]